MINIETVVLVEVLSGVANSQVVWSILCIALAIYVLRDSKKREDDSRKREANLVTNLNTLTAAQTEQANTMKNLCNTLAEIKYTNDRLERILYRTREKENDKYEN